MSVVNGERLALQDAGGRVGKFTIRYVSLNDAEAATGTWEPGLVSANARRAGQDTSTVAYLGELTSGATAFSLPILNEAGILQVSPSNTAVGLTRAQGANKGEPDKYYPSGTRNFGRVVPNDRFQAAAQVAYQQDNGCTSTYVLDDKDVDGAGLARQVLSTASTQDLNIAGHEAIDPKAANFRTVASTVKATGADCVFFGGATQNNAVQLWKDLHGAMPAVKLFGSAGVAESTFSSKVGASAAKVTFLTSPTLDPKLYPPMGQRFFARYRAEYGASPEPYAILGYEAMSVALLAIKNAGEQSDERQAVVDAFFKIKNKRSVLGTYSIDENGDTTLSDYGGYRIEDGELVFDRVLNGRGAGSP